MDAADEKLSALFALDEPPARDHAFSAAVMQQVMRRRFQEEVAMLSGVSALGALALWALWPVVEPVLVTLSQGMAPAVVVLAVVASASFMLLGRTAPSVGAES